MSSEPIFFDDSFLDEFKDHKRVARQKKYHENEAFLFREKCKFIAIILIAIGLLAVLIGFAIYLMRVPKERIVERVEVPEIIVEIPDVNVRMPGPPDVIGGAGSGASGNENPNGDNGDIGSAISQVFGPEDTDGALGSEDTNGALGSEDTNGALGSEDTNAGNGPAISTTVSVFDHVEVGDHTVSTGVSYEPPFTEGLGEFNQTSKWCYVQQINSSDQEIMVDLMSTSQSVEYHSQNIQDVMSLSEWENYRSFCR